MFKYIPPIISTSYELYEYSWIDVLEVGSQEVFFNVLERVFG